MRKLYQGNQHWRVLVEGALFEGRIGMVLNARKIFKELCQTVGNGPIFLEASRYEEREGNIAQSLDFCEEGLDINPRYAPLWF